MTETELKEFEAHNGECPICSSKRMITTYRYNVGPGYLCQDCDYFIPQKTTGDRPHY